MSTIRLIGVDSVCRALSYLVIRFAGNQLHDQNLVQPRPLADHRGLPVLWPGMDRLLAQRQITGLDYLTLRVLGEKQQVAFLRSGITAGPIFGRRSGPTRWQERSGCEPRQKKGASGLVRSLHS